MRRLPHLLIIALAGAGVALLLPSDRMPAAPPTRYLPGASFPLGVFEDANIIGGDQARFAALLEDLDGHQLDAVMLTNGSVERDAPLLDAAGATELGVFFLPASDLIAGWWSAERAHTHEQARAVVAPIVARLQHNRSLKGYIIADEPGLDQKIGVALLTDAFSALDPTRPAMPILIGTDRVGPIFAAARPAVLLINVYPVGYGNAIGDFTLTGFGYRHLDFVSYIRQVSRHAPPETPMWIILQAHRYGNGGPFSLREPVPAEVRAQHWLAIGEGVTGIFWFVYSSQQGWIGLADNETLFDEVKALAARTRPLRELLLDLEKIDDRFTIRGTSGAYISTLATTDGRSLYVVVVNRDCEAPQQLRIRATTLRGALRDLESRQIYQLDEPIDVRPGDGRLFEFVGTAAPATHADTAIR